MTGYGEAVVETEDFVLGLDVRTFNHRFLKLSCKIPEEIVYVQNELEDTLRKRLVRGSVSLTVRFEPRHYCDLYEVDTDVVKKYAGALRKLNEDLGADGEIRAQDLLLLPGAIRSEENPVLGKDRVVPAAIEAAKRALDAVAEMRETEGRNLKEELRQRSASLDARIATVKAAAPGTLEESFHRLEERIRKLLGDQANTLRSEDVVKEAAILAERADVAEEIARLESHLEQFHEALESTSPVGRKLEFIVQEMLRESNTMGSKVANSKLNRHIVEIKAEVDRLKEQVLNIE